jgi:hypothetical protein
MNNASYHSIVLDNASATQTWKNEIVAWLCGKITPHSATQTQAELQELMRENKLTHEI